MICRVGFCPHCKERRRPKTDDAFVAIGAKGDYHVYYADHNGELGFVPHIYELLKVIGENVIYRKICTMHDCGTEIDLRYIPPPFVFKKEAWERGMMTITSWNALQQLKETGYRI